MEPGKPRFTWKLAAIYAALFALAAAGVPLVPELVKGFLFWLASL